MKRRRAEDRRITRAKIKFYQALYDSVAGTLTEIEAGLMALLEADPEVQAAIDRAERAARRRQDTDGE